MVAREREFSKIELSIDDYSSELPDECDRDSAYMPPFLEICSSSDMATGSGTALENQVDNSTRLGSIWIYIAKLSMTELEGK